MHAHKLQLVLRELTAHIYEMQSELESLDAIDPKIESKLVASISKREVLSKAFQNGDYRAYLKPGKYDNITPKVDTGQGNNPRPQNRFAKLSRVER